MQILFEQKRFNKTIRCIRRKYSTCPPVLTYCNCVNNALDFELTVADLCLLDRLAHDKALFAGTAISRVHLPAERLTKLRKARQPTAEVPDGKTA